MRNIQILPKQRDTLIGRGLCCGLLPQVTEQPGRLAISGNRHQCWTTQCIDDSLSKDAFELVLFAAIAPTLQQLPSRHSQSTVFQDQSFSRPNTAARE